MKEVVASTQNNGGPQLEEANRGVCIWFVVDIKGIFEREFALHCEQKSKLVKSSTEELRRVEKDHQADWDAVHHVSI